MLSLFRALSAKHRRVLYRMLLLSVERDLTLVEVLSHVSYSLTSGRSRTRLLTCVDSWRSSMIQGSSLSQVFQGWLPQAHVVLLVSADRAGNLAQGIRGCQILDLEVGRMRRAISGALVYPLVSFFAVAALLYFYTYHIAPIFTAMQDPATWTGAGAALAYILRFVEGPWPFILTVSLAGLSLSFILILPRWTGTLRSHLEPFPPFSFYRLSVASSFLLSLSILVDAGVLVPHALSTLRTNVRPWLRSKIDVLLRLQLEGESLHAAFSKADPYFPDPGFNRDLSLLMRVGGQIASFETYTLEWLSESVDRVGKQAAVVRMAVLGVVALLLAVLMLGNLAVSQQFATTMSY